MMLSEDSPPLRISSQEKEGNLQVSKWLHWQVLLGEKEMAALFENIFPFHIHSVSCVVNEPHGHISHEQFLHEYTVYVEALKNGRDPDEKRCRSFSLLVHERTKSSYAMEVGENRYLLNPFFLW
jgi:hypothetical protein